MFLLIRRVTRSYLPNTAEYRSKSTIEETPAYCSEIKHKNTGPLLKFNLTTKSNRDLNRKYDKENKQYPNFCFVLCKALLNIYLILLLPQILTFLQKNSLILNFHLYFISFSGKFKELLLSTLRLSIQHLNNTKRVAIKVLFFLLNSNSFLALSFPILFIIYSDSDMYSQIPYSILLLLFPPKSKRITYSTGYNQ